MTSSDDCTQPHAHHAIAQGNYYKSALTSGTVRTPSDCHVLSNTFQIKNKSHYVSMNCHHIGWQLFEKNRQHYDVDQHVCNGKLHQTSDRSDSNDEGQQSKASKQPSHALDFENIIKITRSTTKLLKTKRYPNTEANRQADSDPSEKYLIIYYAKRIIKSPMDCNRWRVCHLTLYNADSNVIKQWHQELEKRLHSLARVHLKHVLMFINPYSGRKNGLQTYERWCKPIIELSGIDVSCIITQRQYQIRDILMTHSLQSYDAVCCVGGDGTVAEMINGLIWRAMLDHNLDVKRPDYIPKPYLPISIIPGGSTNTIAYSLHGTADVETSAIHLVLGIKRGLDVCSVQKDDSLIRFCTSVMSYGYLGDVCAKSEKYRWMGVKRYEYTGFMTFLQNRGYAAEIHLLCDDNVNDATPTTHTDSICYANCKRCYSECENEHSDQTKQNYNGQFRPIGVSQQQMMSKQLPKTDLNSSAKAKWRSIKGNFFMISAVNMTCACTRSPNGLSKFCHLGDGYMDLVLVHKTNFLNNIRLIINTMRKNGDIRNLPFVEVHRARQFNFLPQSCDYTCETDASPSQLSVHKSTEPITTCVRNSDNKFCCKHQSVWNCDGEAINDLQVTITSHRQLIDVLMRGPFPYTDAQNGNTATAMLCCCKSN